MYECFPPYLSLSTTLYYQSYDMTHVWHVTCKSYVIVRCVFQFFCRNSRGLSDKHSKLICNSINHLIRFLAWHFTYKDVGKVFSSHLLALQFIVKLIFYKIEIMTMQRPSMVRIGILMVFKIILLIAAGFACVYIIQSTSTTPSSGKLMIQLYKGLGLG